MNDASGRTALLETLAVFGSELSRWPAPQASAAREALLRDPEFRRAWERERGFEGALRADCDARDRAALQSGALQRIRGRTLARLPGPPIGIRWERIAAAMLVAGVLGGALDLVLVEPAAETSELVMLDPLYGLDGTEIR